MTGLERKALFKAAITLRQLTMAKAAAQLGISYNHLILVLRGDRIGSGRLEGEIAQFVRKPVRELFPGRAQKPRGVTEAAGATREPEQ
jgi:transcriptional regulator with XRE-family HTH domain